MSKKFLDPDHPMFRKMWVRWVTVLVPTGWAVLEFYMQSPFWGIIFGAVAVYAAKQLFFTPPDR